MTDCPNVEMRERLPDLLHGRLEGAARVEVQAHLATCEACAAELALLQEARRALDRAPAVDVRRIVAALPRPVGAPLTVSRGGGVEAPARRAVPAWRRYAVAAGLLLAAGVGGYPLLRGAGADAAPDRGPLAGASATATPTSPASQTGAGSAAEDRLLAVNVEGLSDDDFVGLLDALDDLEAVPASDPLPLVPVEASVGGGD